MVADFLEHAGNFPQKKYPEQQQKSLQCAYKLHRLEIDVISASPKNYGLWTMQQPTKHACVDWLVLIVVKPYKQTPRALKHFDNSTRKIV